MPDQGNASSLRQAVDRILGYQQGGQQQQQSDFQLFKPVLPDVSSLSNTLGTSAAITNPLPAPVAEPAPVATAVPSQITYANQLRNDLALSGITGKHVDAVINNSLAAGGYDANTLYDPNSRMNLNPGIPSGSVRKTVTRSGF